MTAHIPAGLRLCRVARERKRSRCEAHERAVPGRMRVGPPRVRLPLLLETREANTRLVKKSVGKNHAIDESVDLERRKSGDRSESPRLKYRSSLLAQLMLLSQLHRRPRLLATNHFAIEYPL